jgi:hypothetical protein
MSEIGRRSGSECRRNAERLPIDGLMSRDPRVSAAGFPREKTPRIAVEDRMDRAMLHIDAG